MVSQTALCGFNKSIDVNSQTTPYTSGPQFILEGQSELSTAMLVDWASPKLHALCLAIVIHNELRYRMDAHAPPFARQEKTNRGEM